MKEGVQTLNGERQVNDQPTMGLDIAVHIGDVMYGNVGSQTRLDFTVIGPAVNEVSRIEVLCDTLETDFLASGEFVKAAVGCQQELTSCGFHALRGVREPIELFLLA